MTDSPFYSASPNSIQEDVSDVVEEKELEKYLEIFRQADDDKDGFFLGAQAKALFQRSGLANRELAKIWRLSDRDCDARLNETEFCIAMHLTNNKLKGKPIPETLPEKLIKSFSKPIN